MEPENVVHGLRNDFDFEARFAICRSVSAECSLTLFYPPEFSEDGRTLSFLCVRNASEFTVVHSVTAVLTFDDVITLTIHQTKLSSTDNDMVQFHFTAEHLRGQFGKRVGSLLFLPRDDHILARYMLWPCLSDTSLSFIKMANCGKQ